MILKKKKKILNNLLDTTGEKMNEMLENYLQKKYFNPELQKRRKIPQFIL